MKRLGRTRSYTIIPNFQKGANCGTDIIFQVVSPAGVVMCGCGNPGHARKIRRALELTKQHSSRRTS